MRALAEFIMRGRVQASVVALIGSWFPLISPATVALVSLRHGTLDGIMILLWALLPALVTFWMSEMSPLMPMVTITGFAVTLSAAQLLRNGASWSQTLMGLVAISCLIGGCFGIAMPEPIQQITQLLNEMLVEFEKNGQVLPALSETFVIGLISYVIAASSLLSLLLARWWQSLLYNPGGFQQEFHQMRLTPPQALLCVGIAFFCWLQAGDLQTWLGLVMLPLQMVGLAIAHYAVKARNLGKQWLVMLYLGMLLVGPITVLLGIIAVFDSWTNLRARIPPKS